MKLLLDKTSLYSKNGFTLVELAIALMVIGLLIGGVLKGQELIENTRVTATIRDIKSYDAAVMIFRNTYGALPGDIRRPSRIPGCNESLCNVAGNGNGLVAGGRMITSEDHEFYNFFPHLTKAGLIKGPEGGTQAQQEALAPYMGQQLLQLLSMSLFDESLLFVCTADSPDYQDQLNNLMPASGRIRDDDMGGDLRTNWPTDSEEYTTFFPIVPIDGVGLSVDPIRNSHAYHLRPVPVRLADQIDSKLDDGYANSGDITDGLMSAESRLEQADGGRPGDDRPRREEPRTYDQSGRGGTTLVYINAAY